jgi:hypothetical protein
VPQVCIPDGETGYSFEGELLGGGPETPAWSRYDGQGAQHPRWTELELYARDAGGYVLYVASVSRVWHLPGARHVRRPARVPAAELAADTVYCGALPRQEGRRYCPDPAAAAGQIASLRTVAAEQPQYRITPCPDAPAVVQRLVRPPQAGRARGALSRPAQELLEQAAHRDPAFAGPLAQARAGNTDLAAYALRL